MVVWNPRTGSHSHHELLWKHKDRLFQPDSDLWRETDHMWNHYHMNYAAMCFVYGKYLDISDYTVFSFYREPVDWFLSAVKYKTNTQWNLGFHINMSPRAFYERSDLSEGQYPFLCAPKTELFNFHDFDNETVRMFGLLGIEITPQDIPKINNEPPKEQRGPLSEAELSRIRHYWRRDFEFFESRGIKFT